MDKMIVSIVGIFVVSAIGLGATWLYSIPLEWVWNTYLAGLAGFEVSTHQAFGVIFTLSLVHVIVFFKVSEDRDMSISEAIQDVLLKIAVKLISIYVPWSILYVIS